MAGRRRNGHASDRDGGSHAIEVPDVHPATFNPRGKSAGKKRKNGNGRNPVVPGSGAKHSVQYNCAKCPGYCCSYPVIQVSKYDCERLGKHFGISAEEAEKRFTKSQHGYKRILRRKKDELFHQICRFFDTEKRCCTIYHARPTVCRAFPGAGRCGYYDFLSFERRAQNDPEFVALTDNR